MGIFTSQGRDQDPTFCLRISGPIGPGVMDQLMHVAPYDFIFLITQHAQAGGIHKDANTVLTLPEGFIGYFQVINQLIQGSGHRTQLVLVLPRLTLAIER